VVIGLLLLISLSCFSHTVSASNIIAGTIYDKARNPLIDIDIELLDEYQRLIRREKTTGTGRYEFSVSNSGRYYLRVFAFRYDLMDETREISIANVVSVPGQQGSSYNVEDFYLQPKRGGLRDAELSVIFAQDVPKEAERVYKKAIDDLAKKKSDEGFAGLQESIRLFPEYYAATSRLSTELYLRRQYLDAARGFLRAAEINPKSAMSYYYAGSALHNQGKEFDKAALTALVEALKLAPASPPVLLMVGTVERSLGRFTEAEKHLLQAKKLSPERIPEIQKELAQLYANDLKKYKEAADELELYIKASKLSDADEIKTRQLVSSLRAKANGQSSN
jgi:tetratricopeptide (TPR) repeat protein